MTPTPTPVRSERVSRWQELCALLLPAAMFAFMYVSANGVAFARVLSARAASAPLRICADPNNLPFSNARQEGFENKIAELVGRELGGRVTYTWWAQRRGFVRNTLSAGDCDLVVGTVSGMEMLATTRPYYKSAYVFVSRRDRHLGIRSFDDPRLRSMRIGVQLIGDDFANTPPAHALANRGMTRNVVGFTVYGDYRQQDPGARIVDAVVRRNVDLAVVWGPIGGYAAQRSPIPLDVVPVSPRVDLPYLPFIFDIAMGVRRADSTFRHQLDEVIEHRQASIDSILDAYGVPRVDVGMRGGRVQ